jgi:hypothetical protein
VVDKYLVYGNVDRRKSCIETSIRLTVTVYSPVCELTVDLCFVENG